MAEKENKIIQQKKEDMLESKLNEKYDRNSFIKKMGVGVFAGLVIPALTKNKLAVAAKTIDKNSDQVILPKLPKPTDDEDVIIRMQRDLERALQKPVDQRKWAMVIDLRKCVGCHSCTVSCAAENKLPPGVVYRPVLSEEIGTYPNVTERFIPRPCMQCEEPPCVDVCPVHATWKREDGIVEIDYDQCIGCRYCITACPYSARTFDTGHFYTEGAPEKDGAFVGEEARVYEEEPTYGYGIARLREEGESPIGNARKCTFCIHRVEKGLLPECVVSCIGRATYFGDANDPKSLVSELIGSPNSMRLKEDMGTNPKVFYLL